MHALSRLPLLLLVILLAVAPPGGAWAAAGCGTVVLPAGLGQSDPQGVTSLNPLLTTSVYNKEIIYQIYRPLVWIDRNVAYDPELSLASAVETPDGGQTWRMTIKPWLWSDGVPVTAADVVFTFDLIRRIGPAYVWYKVGGIPNLIDHVVALSPHEVELKLTRKVNPDWFLRLGLGNTFSPLPEHVYRGLSVREMRMRQTDPKLFAVSDSAFLLADYQVGRHLTLVPNPLYGGQHPHIKRLVIDFLEGGNALQALRSGEIDAANVPFRLWNLARSLPGLRTARLDGPFGYLSMMMNFQSHHAPFLNDLRVRQAIATAINQKEIIALAFHGQDQEIHGPVPIAMTAFLSAQAKAGYSNLDYNPARARALLDAAGWKPGPDGIRVRDGQRLAFNIEVSAGVVDRLITLQVIQRNLAAVGIAMDIRGVEFNELFATLNGNGHDWDSIMIGWTVENFPDSQEFFSSDGTQNYGHFRDARVDALNEAVINTAGDQALHEVQDYIAQLQPFIFLPTGRISALARVGLDGVRAMISPTGGWSPELLTLSGPMACPDLVSKAGRETADAHPVGG